MDVEIVGKSLVNLRANLEQLVLERKQTHLVSAVHSSGPYRLTCCFCHLLLDWQSLATNPYHIFAMLFA